MTELTPIFAGSAGDQWPVVTSFKQSCGRLSIRDSFECFSSIKKCLGQTEMRIRERKCFQSK